MRRTALKIIFRGFSHGTNGTAKIGAKVFQLHAHSVYRYVLHARGHTAPFEIPHRRGVPELSRIQVFRHSVANRRVHARSDLGRDNSYRRRAFKAAV